MTIVISTSRQTWIQISHDLKTREHRSLQNLTLSTRRFPWYIMLGRILCNYWFPLRFWPSILLQPSLPMNNNVEDHDMAIELQQWKRLRENHGYFDYVKDELGEKKTSDLRLLAEFQNFMVVGEQ